MKPYHTLCAKNVKSHCDNDGTISIIHTKFKCVYHLRKRTRTYFQNINKLKTIQNKCKRWVKVIIFENTEALPGINSNYVLRGIQKFSSASGFLHRRFTHKDDIWVCAHFLKFPHHLGSHIPFLGLYALFFCDHTPGLFFMTHGWDL